MKSVTIIIKTFERPHALRNLLRSIEQKGLTNPILIADDSKVGIEADIKSEFPCLHITYLSLPFDSGLSEGRNRLVNSVQTEFFLLCDDDYVFEDRTDIDRALKVAINNGIDILGGEYYNYVNIPNMKVFVRQLNHPFRLARFFFNRYQRSSYIGNFRVGPEGCELLVNNSEPGEELTICDLVNNFFIARTESVRKMGGWDAELKMGEHEDFFYRAKQHKLKVAFLKGFGTGHYPAIPVKNSAYNQYRVRAAFYKSLFVKKHGFKKYIEKETGTGKVLFVFKN